MDNRLFNVNGGGDELLEKTLEFAFAQESEKCTCSGWAQTKETGLILCWAQHDKDITPNCGDLTATQCMPMVCAWLQSDFAKTAIPGEWCGDTDHDGHNSLGWQVYCDDWGHVGDQRYAICGIKPAYLWHGK